MSRQRTESGNEDDLDEENEDHNSEDGEQRREQNTVSPAKLESESGKNSENRPNLAIQL